MIDSGRRRDVVGADLDARVDAGEPFPIVDDELCTFAFHGPAIGVRLVHFGVGLPDDLAFELLDEDGEWWLLTLEMPHGSRLEYKLEVTDSFGTRLVEDPLNWRDGQPPLRRQLGVRGGRLRDPGVGDRARRRAPRVDSRPVTSTALRWARRADDLGLRAGRVHSRPQRRAIRSSSSTTDPTTCATPRRPPSSTTSSTAA